MIEISHITKIYGQQKALDDVSFNVEAGEIVGLLGPNGAGKSTLMKIITCFIPPTEGEVKVCGHDIYDDSMAVRRCIGYLPEQNPLYLDMYVREFLRFVAGVYGLKEKDDRVEEMIKRVGLLPEANKKIGQLSKGYRQRVGFGQAHAPFPSSKGAEPFDTEVRARIIRSMEVASILGVENIIVHPMQHLEFRTHKQELFDMNMDFYRSLIPECERLNIHVCAENMWQHDKRRGYIVDSTCSQPDEFVQYIDTIGSPWIRACLDIGHTALVGVEPEEAIYALGHDRLKALHVHDSCRS